MIQWCGFPQDQQFLLACTFLEDNIINSWKEGMGGKTKTKKKGLAWHTNAFKREGPGKWMSEDAKRREAFFSPGGSERGDLLGRTKIFHTIYHRSSTFACLVTKKGQPFNYAFRARRLAVRSKASCQLPRGRWFESTMPSVILLSVLLGGRPQPPCGQLWIS